MDPPGFRGVGGFKGKRLGLRINGGARRGREGKSEAVGMGAARAMGWVRLPRRFRAPAHAEPATKKYLSDVKGIFKLKIFRTQKRV